MTKQLYTYLKGLFTQKQAFGHLLALILNLYDFHSFLTFKTWYSDIKILKVQCCFGLHWGKRFRFGRMWGLVTMNWMFIFWVTLLNDRKVLHLFYPKHLPQVRVSKPKGDIGNMEPFRLSLPTSFLVTSSCSSATGGHRNTKRLWVRRHGCQRIILWGR